MSFPSPRARSLLAGTLSLILVTAACTRGGDEEAAASDPAVTTPVAAADEADDTASDNTTADEATETSTTLPSIEPEGDALDLDREIALPEGQLPEELGPLGETELVVESEDGTLAIGTDDVPEVLDEAIEATAIPLPDDFEVQIASESSEDLGFSGTSGQSVDDLRAFYDNELEAAGFTLDDRTAVDDTLVVYTLSSGAGDGQLAISETPGGNGATLLATWNS